VLITTGLRQKSYNRPLRIFFFGAVLRLMLRPPGYHPKKQRALYEGVFSDGTPVLGRGTPGVVVGVAQNGTVGCEKVNSGGLPAKRLAKRGVEPESA
tara:strand:- start:90 stop:380 length:291 start_codon:yes stop_codon:yes gene_type:complete